MTTQTVPGIAIALMGSTLAVTTPVAWAIAGAVLCALEFVLPTAFVIFALGVSAMVVAVVALVVPQLSLQVMLWMVCSTLAVAGVRQMAAARRPRAIAEATEAKTLVAIPPGKDGRVLYEGSSWRARCADAAIPLASQQQVLVVRREGNTLYVLPTEILD
ncbi:membrane protein implicated in regulation of membrane protease activity [Rubidibacter lacunae KORDI 51-2]|uniref:Membrane protein implicated in regulation of membrane protease activity n=1 Tax=Rubidibacter lacunae KORDI 51-2 TaxID=582515 RepID=U5DQ48_9CHRO|nr:NfeD family protein [Rubidibacter lacunae]ERN42977.1 membrane protein implicated in regulation of membrane protease activity [Rubidibacter lacunae KORDI 51-2]